MYWNQHTENLSGGSGGTALGMTTGKAHDHYSDNMHTSTSSPPASHRKSLLTQVMQGMVLGTVFAVPVAFWAYNAAQPLWAAESPALASPSKGTSRAARIAPPRKAMRVADAEAPTIPASQMRVRIDDGRRRNRAASAAVDN